MTFVTATSPAVVKFPPVILPVADTIPPVLKFDAKIFPEAVTCPAVRKLPALTLPATDKLVSVPREVKKLEVTFALSILPTIAFAGALEVTPDNNAPLPRNNPPDTMLPVALIMPLPVNNPFNVAPVPETTNTLATLALLILITPSSTMLMFESPF